MPVQTEHDWKDWPCKEWPGEKDKDGYGRIRVSRDKFPQRVHRAEWESENGPVPEGLMVLHRCDNRPCHEIDHLFLGTNAVNMADRNRKGRQARMAGPANPRAKLMQEQVNEIIEELRGRKTAYCQWDLAEKYGVHHKTIARIWRRRANGGY